MSPSLAVVHRLAIGVEVVDALRAGPADVQVHLEAVPQPYPVPVGPLGAGGYDPGIGLPVVPRGTRPGRFRLLHGPGLQSPAVLRIVDRRRRFVPRRLRIPFTPLQDLIAAEEAGHPTPPRGRVISVYPGADYHPYSSATGVRGLIVDHTGAPVRWARVRARHQTRDVTLGVAHGDDRGEFLLVLGPAPDSLAAPGHFRFSVRLTVTARLQPPVGGPAHSLDDPLADLLVEQLPPLGAPDQGSAGTQEPAAYPVTTTVEVSCRLGRLVSLSTPISIE